MTEKTCADDLGYILCTVAQHDDFALWWRPDGSGYTSDIDDAGQYTRAEAASWGGRDRFVLKAVVDRVARRVAVRSALDIPEPSNG